VTTFKELQKKAGDARDVDSLARVVAELAKKANAEIEELRRQLGARGVQLR
jgi:hypothetical protein